MLMVRKDILVKKAKDSVQLLFVNFVKVIKLCLTLEEFETISWLQDSDGEAGIALVGVHSEYPKYTQEEKFPDDKGPATVG